MSFESFNTSTLQNIIPSYLYEQYANDSDLQAFVASFNSIAQSYLDWYNETPLSVYTDQSISGLLLDWMGQGLYGVYRPVIATSTVSTYGFYNSFAYNEAPYNSLIINQSGTAFVASDDIYKRALTWNLYIGDGKQATIEWLKKRVARFVYGTNGTDISLNDVLNVRIKLLTTSQANGYNQQVYNESLYMAATTSVISSQLNISIPTSPAAQTFQMLFESGVLPSPFQVNITVTLT